jgi:hypothetical protein
MSKNYTEAGIILRAYDREVPDKRLQITRVINTKEFKDVYSHKQSVPIGYNTGTSCKKFEDVPCGFSLSRKYAISDLLCGTLGEMYASEILDMRNPYKCTGFGSNLSSNLVRVAGTRMMSDINGSLKEPVSNSIDSIRNRFGSDRPGIGKFGMGFFSLFQWFEDDMTALYIVSRYIREDIEGICEWTARITYDKKEDEYYFEILRSKMVSDMDGETGLTLYLINVNFIPSIEGDFLWILRSSFTLVDDITIEYIFKYHKDDRFVDKYHISSNENAIGKIQVVNSIIKGDKYISFKDNGEGISIQNFFEKLMLPSISTKTIEKSLSSDLGYYPDNKVTKINTMRSYFVISVGGIGVISIKDDFTPGGAYMINLSLPRNIPLPVSRDDIILDDPRVFQIVLERLVNLTVMFIGEGINFKLLQDMLGKYRLYANDSKVDILISSWMSEIKKMNDIILIPKNTPLEIKELLTTGSFVLVPSSNPDIPRYSRYLSTNFITYDDIFIDVLVITISGLKDKTGKVSTSINTPGFIAVDINFIGSPNWIEKVSIQSDIHLSIYTKDKRKKENSLKLLNASLKEGQTVFTKDNTSSLNRPAGKHNKVVKYGSNHVTNYYDIMLKYSVALSGSSEKMGKVVYSFISGLINRTVISSGVNPTVTFYHGIINRAAILDPIPSTNMLLLPDSEDFLVSYMIEYYEIINGASSPFVEIGNPLSIFIADKSLRDDSIDIFNFLKDKHPIYTYYITIILRKLEVELNGIPKLKYVTYLYREIYSKYPLEGLSTSLLLIQYHTKDNFTIMIDELISSLKIFLNVDNIQAISRVTMITGYAPDVVWYKFTGNQLINHVFLQPTEVTDENIEWMDNIQYNPRYSPMQILRTAINEGTSKRYVEAVLTELLQNSIDAGRDILDPKIEIEISPHNLVVRDNIGMTLGNIIALMIPFLSTKSKSQMTTGEMGTGFMNVYRQPYTNQVRIITKDPETKMRYIINARPVVDKDQVVDLEYDLIRDSWPAEDGHQGTELSIFINEMNQEDISSLISEVVVYSYKYLYGVIPNITINDDLIHREKELLLSTPEVDIYTYTDRSKKNSTVILTNGTPFSIYSIDTTLQYQPGSLIPESTMNLIVDIKKDSYRPTQSRKRIKYSSDEVEKAILYATYIMVNKDVTMVIEDSRFRNKDKGKERLERFMPGLTYRGTADQVLPDMRDNVINLMNYQDPTYQQVNMAEIITKIINKVDAKPLMEKLHPSAEKLLHIWFANKSGLITSSKNVGSNLNYPGKVNSDIVTIRGDKHDSSPELEIISLFTKKLVVSVWTWLTNPSNKFTMWNRSITKQPPTLYYYSTMTNARGYYMGGNDHSINLLILDKELGPLSKSISKYKQLSKTNLKEAIKFYRTDGALTKYSGFSPVARVLIHEFSHAVRGDFHENTNSHGDFKYKVGDNTYEYSFERGSNEIWRLGIENFFS